MLIRESIQRGWPAVRNRLQSLGLGVRSRVFSGRGWILGIVLLLAALIGYYVKADRYTPFTTDAFVQAFVIQVNARVEGQVVRVAVLENQPVKKGDLLFEIDPRPFQHRVELLEARLVDAVQQVAQMQSELEASRADDARFAAAETYAHAVQQQETAIFKQEATTERRYLDAIQKYRMARADRLRSRALSNKVEKALEARVGREHALVAEIRAQLEDARLNLGWTRIYAPANGYVSNVQLREGSYVRAGTPVLSCIDTDQWWIVANYRENTLENIRPGQRVAIAFNAYPGRIFAGTVKTVGPGVYQGQAAPSGNLPAVAEPPNWIRLAQRFPVWVTPQTPEGTPLRIGVTASVVVYTRERYWLNQVTGAWHRSVATLDYLY